jgi:hypothetical protein
MPAHKTEPTSLDQIKTQKYYYFISKNRKKGFNKVF